MVFRHTCVNGNKQIVSSHSPLPFEGYMALEPDAQVVRREMQHKIFVSVQGGVAEDKKSPKNESDPVSLKE